MRMTDNNVLARRLAATISCIATLSIAGATASTAAPIPDSIAQKPVSLNVQKAGVVSVLRTLFKASGANFSIDSDVRGIDTISLNNVTFAAALRSILHANEPKLTYDYHDGVFHVSVAKIETAAVPASPSTPSTYSGTTSTGSVPTSGAHYYKIPVDHYDVMMMAMLLRSSTAKTVSIVPSATVGGSSSMGGGSMGMSGMGMNGAGMRGGTTGMTGAMGNMGNTGMRGGMGGYR